MREVVQLVHRGRPMTGTLHRPPPGRASPERPGVLFLNAGHVPRDGHAGLWARVGDLLAERGHVVARFDRPGLGDSPGPLPERIETFWADVKKGGLADDALAAARWLREHHAPAGVVAGGLCGAAITALYAAERDPTDLVGLVLMEPEFYLLDPANLPAPEGGATAPRRHPATRLLSTFSWLRLLSGANRHLKTRLPRVRRAATHLLLRVLSLPERTNLELVGAWRRTLDLGLPVLVLTVRDDFWDIYYRKATEFVLGGRPPPPSLRHVQAEDTSHAFTRGEGVAVALREIAAWMEAAFPEEAPQRGHRPAWSPVVEAAP